MASPSVKFISPIKDEKIGRKVNIIWDYSNINDMKKEVYLYYSTKDNTTWARCYKEPLINSTNYLWNTITLPDGEYQLLIQCFIGEDIIHNTSNYFYILNGNNNITIKDTLIRDTTISSDEFVKNHHDVEVLVNITNDQIIKIHDIEANISSLGGGYNVEPSYFDGHTAKWTIKDVLCTPSNGIININITVKNIREIQLNITADNTAPFVNLSNPKEGIYLGNKKIIPFDNTLIIGPPTIELSIDYLHQIKTIEIQIDNEPYNIITNPKEKKFRIDRRLIGKYSFSIVITDYAGNKKTMQHELRIINL